MADGAVGSIGGDDPKGHHIRRTVVGYWLLVVGGWWLVAGGW
jgi:hypothetical protein